ncbi:hypothetical protein TRFO_02005 [Tritrichomonas foetus]|uniref:Uncharacterized protein n=1 Tax=Tritrichomonas foetus TaxID=1144522 RepID=A0A1J4JF34_9EUKA|nr:hypothetical protein TRFO_02005 [Tritrichomonas foetus]|eukprot:OHS96903.1 hypothetical protein TRFO_02005 [Tritrichomonas foetus]
MCASRRAPRPSPYLYSANRAYDYREIVISLVSGVDISLIDPELYSGLVPVIEQYKLKFQDRNDSSSIQRLNFCLEYIENYPKREQIAKILTKKRKDPPPKEPPFSENEVDQEINERLLKFDFSRDYSQEELEQLLTELRARRIRCADEEDFDKADLYAEVTTKLIREGEITQLKRINYSKNHEYDQKLIELKKSYSDLKKRWRKIEKNFKIESQKEIENLKNEQQQEIYELEKRKEEPIPSKYKKYSIYYLHLKQQENMLVNSKNFDEAVIAQQRVKEQQIIEDRKNWLDWHARIDEEKKKLEQKHRQQLSARENSLKREEETMERSKKKELMCLSNKIAFFESQINSNNSHLNGSNNSQKVSQNTSRKQSQRGSQRNSQLESQRNSTRNSTRVSQNNSQTNSQKNLPRLKNSNANNGPQSARRMNGSDAQVFRQRAILNKQLYCAKALLGNKTQKKQRSSVRKPEETDY